MSTVAHLLGTVASYRSIVNQINWSPTYDTITGVPVVGAWGLRRLVSSFSGPVVRVRDTSTNAEQDVGLDSTGWLAAFSVTGNAAVVTLYDQSGNGNHLTQTTQANQPILVRNAASLSGRPAIQFDGVNDFLHDAITGTAKSYMVAYPIIALEGAGRGGGASFGAIANVPHQVGSNSDPYYRWSIQRYFTSNDLELRLSGATSASGPYSATVRELHYGNSVGSIFLCANGDRVIDGSSSFDGPRAPGDAVTYPNATGLRLGCNGAGGDASNSEVTSIVVLSDSTSSVSTIQTWHDNISRKNVSKVTDKVMDVTLATSPPADTSDRAHPMWLSNGATISSGRLDPGTGGALVVHQSGLLVPSTDYTFECEVFFTSLITNRRIAGNFVNLSQGWTLSTHDVNSNQLMLVVGGVYIVTGEHGSSAALVANTWYTVRFTRSGTTFRIYVNGVERAMRNIAPGPIYTARPLLIGNSHDRTQPFPGYIRNVKAWSGIAIAP